MVAKWFTNHNDPRLYLPDRWDFECDDVKVVKHDRFGIFQLQ